MSRYILFFVLILFFGCDDSTYPLPCVVRTISEEPYIKDVYDCTQKAEKLVKIYRGMGYKDAETVLVAAPEGGHLIVKCRGWYVDPTIGEGKRTLKEFGYIPIIIDPPASFSF